MKKNSIALTFGFISLLGCSQIPEVEPINHQVLSVFPNPASFMANISVGSQINEAFTLQVFNARGERILQEKGNQGGQNYFVDIADEPAGKYQVILTTGNKTATQKFIKL